MDIKMICNILYWTMLILAWISCAISGTIRRIILCLSVLSGIVLLCVGRSPLIDGKLYTVYAFMLVLVIIKLNNLNMKGGGKD